MIIIDFNAGWHGKDFVYKVINNKMYINYYDEAIEPVGTDIYSDKIKFEYLKMYGYHADKNDINYIELSFNKVDNFIYEIITKHNPKFITFSYDFEHSILNINLLYKILKELYPNQLILTNCMYYNLDIEHNIVLKNEYCIKTPKTNVYKKILLPNKFNYIHIDKIYIKE